MASHECVYCGKTTRNGKETVLTPNGKWWMHEACAITTTDRESWGGMLHE